MAYFPNGTTGERFQEKHCDKCVNWREDDGKKDTDGCPIMDIHYFHSYDLCNSKEIGKEILDFLIEEDEKHNYKCKMFNPLQT